MSNADNAMFTDEAGNGIGDESVANTITKDSVVIGSEVENVNGNPDPNNSQNLMLRLPLKRARKN